MAAKKRPLTALSLLLFPAWATAMAVLPTPDAGNVLAAFAPVGTSAWRYVGIPNAPADQPATQFDVLGIDGVPTLRLETKASYGTWVHDLPALTANALAWRWRLDSPLSGGTQAPDLMQKAGDDAALKVCVMFNHDLQRVPFWERTTLRLARSVTGEDLPAATVCYVWDQTYPAGHTGRNPYSARVRFIVLRGPNSPLQTWQTEQRDVGADFKRLFADEHPTNEPPPPLKAVVVGADGDNTKSGSLGWVQAVRLTP